MKWLILEKRASLTWMSVIWNGRGVGTCSEEATRVGGTEVSVDEGRGYSELWYLKVRRGSCVIEGGNGDGD